MSIGSFLLLMLVLVVISIVAKYLVVKLPPPYNPWVLYVIVGICLLVLIVVAISLLGVTGGFLNYRIGH